MVFIKNNKKNVQKSLIDAVLEEHGLITKQQKEVVRAQRKAK